jgi:MerR family transcriptional regulator, copper efflux regulator
LLRHFYCRKNLDHAICLQSNDSEIVERQVVTMVELLAVLRDERVTPRFVRFLIAEGVIPGPRGGRANADYGEDHLTGIRRYLQLRDLGLSASRTKEIVAGSATGGIPVPIVPGLTLIVDPEKLAAPPPPAELARRVAEALRLIKPEE